MADQVAVFDIKLDSSGAVAAIQRLQASVTEGAAAIKKQLDGVEEGTKTMGAGFDYLKAGLVGLAAFQGFRWLGQSVKQFAEAEAAGFRLTALLKLQGDVTGEAGEQILAFNRELSRTTGVDDDVIASSQATLVALGRLSGSGLERATEAAIDLSRALGIDLETASRTLAKAAAGNTAGLQKLGIVIDESVPKSEKFGAALKIIEERMGGLAKDYLNTTAGKLEMLSTTWGNFREKLGEGIASGGGIKVIDALNEGLDQLIKHLDRFSGKDPSELMKRFNQGQAASGRITSPWIDAIMDPDLGEAILNVEKRWNGLSDAALGNTAAMLRNLEAQKLVNAARDEADKWLEGEEDREKALKKALEDEAKERENAIKKLQDHADKIKVAYLGYKELHAQTLELKRAQDGVNTSFASFGAIMTAGQMGPLTQEQTIQAETGGVTGGLTVDPYVRLLGVSFEELQAAGTSSLDFQNQFVDQWSQRAALLVGANLVQANSYSMLRNSFFGFVKGMESMLGSHNKFVKGLQKIQAAMLLVEGIVTFWKGATTFAQSLFPPNPYGIAAGLTMMGEGAGAIAQARALGASGSANTGGGKGGGGKGRGGGGEETPVTMPAKEEVDRTTTVNIVITGQGFIQNYEQFARDLSEQMTKELKGTGR